MFLKWKSEELKMNNIVDFFDVYIYMKYNYNNSYKQYFYNLTDEFKIISELLVPP